MRSRRYEFDVPGGGTASFVHHGKRRPSAKRFRAMAALASAAIAQQATIDRACKPCVGDRLLTKDHTTVQMEVKEILGGEGAAHAVKYTLDGSSREFTDPLKDYQWMVQISIECGETFHAVEDDEE